MLEVKFKFGSEYDREPMERSKIWRNMNSPNSHQNSDKGILGQLKTF